MFRDDATYVHITSNNTIYGTRYRTLPDTGGVPLVADASSNILSEEFDLGRFGIIYAGAQKNIGPAGVTVVIVREDLVGKALETTPTMLNYSTHVDNKSMFNTPPTYAIYIAKLVFEWLDQQGGVQAMQKINEEKAGMLYEFLDNSSLFNGTAAVEDRSIMNVPFVLPSDELNARFIKLAAQEGLVTLKGHRSVGGMRASIYNAMPREGVVKLVDFMKRFEQENR
jgi:phosphoserine aminotransferase